MNDPSFEELPFVVVAAAIIYQEGKVLLTRRKIDTHQGGLWEFPGGKQEVGETLVQCLKRELKEEVDIEVNAVQHFCTLCHRYPEKEVELHFFTCSIIQGDPKPLGSIEMAWVPKSRLLLHEFPDADRPVVRKLLERNLEKESSS